MGNSLQDRLPPGWTVKPLIDCTDNRIISYGIVQPGRHVETGIPILRVNNFSNGSLDLSDPLKVSQDVEKSFSRTRLEGGEVLLTLVGSTGQSVIASPHVKGWNVARAVAVIRPSAEVGAEWINIILKSQATAFFLDAHANTTVQKTLNLTDVKRLPIPLPPEKIKEFIERNHRALENKIELNCQMNTTLESMAQALFKSWFVDFDPVIDNALAAGNPIPDELAARAERRKQLHDRKGASSSEHLTSGQPLPAAIQQQFPDRFVFTEALGWVPEGWEAVSLDEIIELIGGGTPKTSIEEYWGGDIPWFSVVDAPAQSNVFVSRTEKYISALGLENSSTKMLREGTTIISARGTVGKCALVGKPMTMNQSCYGIQGKSGIADYFVYYTILLRVADLQQRGHGSVFNTITRDTFKSITTPRCPVELTQHFHDLIAGFFSRILENNQQSDCLASLRDTLLPKLLSGQLRIPEAEQQVAEII